MRKLKSLALAAGLVAAFVALTATTASATELINGSGEMIASGSAIDAEAENTTILHPPFGNIECKQSSVSGKTANTGGSTETVSGSIESLSFTECNATVTVLTKGTLEVHTRTESADGNGTLTSSGTEVTVEFIGTHCIFKTNSTDIGTLTGAQGSEGSATFDIAATIPRTGGRSGAFCGSTAQWTGSYSVCGFVGAGKGRYENPVDCFHMIRPTPLGSWDTNIIAK
jgi:hypothetical protein